MTQEGALLDNLSTIIVSIDPAIVLMSGVALGICGTLAVLKWVPVKWSPAPRRKADPLSGLFAGDTLDYQLARITNPAARDERKDRDASAIRAKIFAHNSAQRGERPKPTQNPIPPHRADRFEHAAVLDHIAKVMRANKDTDEAVFDAAEPNGEWEEVLLLPPPSQDDTSVAKAA